MSGAIRRTKLIDRGRTPFTKRNRDVYLVVVATEDTYAAKQYLQALQESGLIDRSRVEIVTLATTDGHSSLASLLDRLDAHQKALDVGLPKDEYWAVFDLDRQADPSKIQNFLSAIQVAGSRNVGLAGTNPCFELWLLLHLTDDISGIPSATNDRRAAETCEAKLRDVLQGGDPNARGYDKTRIGPERFVSHEKVHIACQRAKALLPNTASPWPAQVGTHMQLLMEHLPTNL